MSNRVWAYVQRRAVQSHFCGIYHFMPISEFMLTVPSKIRKYSSVYVRNKEKKIKERKREFLRNQGPNVCCQISYVISYSPISSEIGVIFLMMQQNSTFTETNPDSRLTELYLAYKSLLQNKTDVYFSICLLRSNGT